jgi:uncharacterized protein YecE (DUF72 family)
VNTGLRIGPSGWVYAHWRKVYCPSGRAQARWFAHYATQFDMVEINNTFYGLADEDISDRRCEQAPSGFVTSVSTTMGSAVR